MGKRTDMTGLQFRMLNTKKGPSFGHRERNAIKGYQFRTKVDWRTPGEISIANKGKPQS